MKLGLPPYGSTCRFLPDQQRQGVSQSTLKVAESLQLLGFGFQQRLELVEITAKLLAETIDSPGERLSRALGKSYASKAVIDIRIQLYRLLIIDLCAAFLDNQRDACSIRRIIDELTRKPDRIAALQDFYSNPKAYEITIQPPLGEGPLAEDVVRRAIDFERVMHATDRRTGIETAWKKIQSKHGLLAGVQAERLKWVRDKAIAHWEQRDDGLVPLNEEPRNGKTGAPLGDGPLSWVEPLDFLRAMRPLAYDVICLLTATSWSEDFDKTHEFYARVFWDHFANGKSDLKPA